MKTDKHSNLWEPLDTGVARLIWRKSDVVAWIEGLK